METSSFLYVAGMDGYGGASCEEYRQSDGKVQSGEQTNAALALTGLLFLFPKPSYQMKKERLS